MTNGDVGPREVEDDDSIRVNEDQPSISGSHDQAQVQQVGSARAIPSQVVYQLYQVFVCK
jgi:hypothetical protein